MAAPARLRPHRWAPPAAAVGAPAAPVGAPAAPVDAPAAPVGALAAPDRGRWAAGSDPRVAASDRAARLDATRRTSSPGNGLATTGRPTNAGHRPSGVTGMPQRPRAAGVSLRQAQLDMLTRRLLPTPTRSRADALETELTVRDGRGALLASGRGGGTPERPRWAWRSPQLGPFSVEPVGDDPPRWFVTRPDGAPFGQLELRGKLPWRRRLEVSDGRGLHLLVTADGTVRAPDGTAVARLRRSGSEAAILDLDGKLPAAWRTLLVTASALLDD
jgi:hypothetical protein